MLDPWTLVRKGGHLCLFCWFGSNRLEQEAWKANLPATRSLEQTCEKDPLTPS